jgi:hypothetical protein
MNKNTQILLGVGILGVGGYLYWKSTQKPKNMVGVSGQRKQIFEPTSSSKIFSADGTSNPLPQNFFNKQGSGWLRGADGQIFQQSSSQPIFKNMAQPMGTQNCGHTGSNNCWS